jgi:guanosine-3',5'-bis(diphosphate) 3'-pyrophosphohydrolase
LPTLERAIEIAANAHTGQIDKAGAPYILHPLRVMLSVHGNNERITAVLHDVVEDTPITFQDLANEGFAAEIIEALRCLTKFDGETRLEAAHRAVQNPLARAVKLADVTDNMDLSRIAQPTEKDYSRLKQYEQVMLVLAGVKIYPDTKLPVATWEEVDWLGTWEREVFVCSGKKSWVARAPAGADDPDWEPVPVISGYLAVRGERWTKEDFHSVYPLVDRRP